MGLYLVQIFFKASHTEVFFIAVKGGSPMGAYKYTPTKLMLPTSRYDKRRADFAVGFIQMLKHTTGE